MSKMLDRETKTPASGTTAPEGVAAPMRTASARRATDPRAVAVGYARAARERWQAAGPVGRRRASIVAGGVGLIVLIAVVAALVIPGLSRPADQSSMPGMQMGPSPNAPAHQLYDPQAPSVPQGDTVNIKLEVKEAVISVAPNMAYSAWTFNGTVPGPVLRVRQGQTVNFTLVNGTKVPHSIDFHAAQTAWNVNYQSVQPGKSFSFSWRANVPGIFMYHCGTPPVMMHMANGMYGAIIVDPANGWSPAREYVLLQSEFYMRQLPNGTYTYDDAKAMASNPDNVVFNGYANQYKDAPLTAKPGEKIRLFLLNAGPSQFSAFHVIGAIFSDFYEDGDPANHMHSSQTVSVPPGGGTVVELTIPDAGSYPFVTHAFSHAMKGALGVIKVE